MIAANSATDLIGTPIVRTIAAILSCGGERYLSTPLYPA